MMSRVRVLALLLVLVAALSASLPAHAAVLCSTRGGGLKLREVCRPRETQVDPIALGLRGPAGPQGLPGWERPCPDDSVRVGTLCVDKYEASVWSIPVGQAGLIEKVNDGTVSLTDLVAGGATQLGCTGAPFNHTAYPASFAVDGNWTPIIGSDLPSPGVYAVSIPGVLPSACISWFQAEQSCTVSGKRLLTNQEWQRAASGTPDPGSADDGTTTCATDSAGPANTGSRSGCKSNWGAFDMVGNVWEWVADWGDLADGTICTDWTTSAGIAGNDVSCMGGPGGSGANSLPGALIRGGYWSGGLANGVFAIGAERRPSLVGPPFGFRCAR
jgi:hypothetical protein